MLHSNPTVVTCSDSVAVDEFSVDTSAASKKSKHPPPPASSSVDAENNKKCVVHVPELSVHDVQASSPLSDGSSAGAAAAAAPAAAIGGVDSSLSLHNASDAPSSCDGGSAASDSRNKAAATSNISGSDSKAAVGGLSELDGKLLTQQLQYNIELFKHKLFHLFSMNTVPSEEQQSFRTIEDMQHKIDELLLSQQPRHSTGAAAAAAPTSASASAFVSYHTTRAANNGSSAASSPLKGSSSNRKLMAGGPGSSSAVLSTPSSAGGRPGSAAAAGTAEQQSQAQKELLALMNSIDVAFRFSYEELALRWCALQERPFSLRAYHEVVATEIQERQRASQAEDAALLEVKAMKRELEASNQRVMSRDTQHAEALRLYLTELRVLRQQIFDLQRRCQAADEHTPQLLDGGDGASKENAALSAEEQKRQEAQGKHLEFINKRLKEECALLSHTLDQRNFMIKSIQTELATAKAAENTLRDEFRRYVAEQEQVDADMRQQFAQNELTAECSAKQLQAQLEINGTLQSKLSEKDKALGYLHLQKDALEATVAESKTEALELRKAADNSRADVSRLEQQLYESEDLRQRETSKLSNALRVAEDKIRTLENSTLQRDLDEAREQISMLQDNVKALNNEVEERDSKIAAQAAEHTATVDMLNKRIATLKSNEEDAKRRREEAIEHERARAKEKLEQLGAQLEKQKEEWMAAHQQRLEGSESLQEQLLHELMLYHRQVTLTEQFLTKNCTREMRRVLAKLIMTPDIMFVGSGNEKLDASTCLPNGGMVDVEQRYTPRTVQYFRQLKQFDPRDILAHIPQQRDLFSSNSPILGNLSPRANDGERASMPKTVLTVDFLGTVVDRRQRRADAGRQSPRLLAASPSLTAAASAKHEHSTADYDCLAQSYRTNLSASRRSGVDPATGGAAAAPASSSGELLQHPGLTDNDLLAMILEDARSQMAAASDRCVALQDELREAQLLLAAATSSARNNNNNDELEKTAAELSAKGRPGSGSRVNGRDLATAYFATSGRPQSASAGTDGSQLSNGPLIVTNHLGSGRQQDHELNASSIATRLDPSCTTIQESHHHAGDATTLSEFPGVEHATEFLDIFEAFELLRHHLQQLVVVCQRDAEQCGLPDAHDLNRTRDLLRAKFSCFRNAESSGHNIILRLKKKKEDVLRHREEELEKVLGAMQNISLTHPKEAQQLIRVAKAAARARASADAQAIRTGSPYVSQVHSSLPSAAATLEMTAVVERPHSSMSYRTRTPEVADVLVSGAPALLSLRNSRLGSAQQRRGKK